MNTYAKGARVQRRAKKYYESLGYEVEVVRYNKFMVNKDYFGLWDLICVSKHNIRFVQVKANRKPNRAWQDKAKGWGCRSSKVIHEWVVYKDYSRGLAPSSRVTLSPHT